MATKDPLILKLQSMGSMVFFENEEKQADTKQVTQRCWEYPRGPSSSLETKHDVGSAPSSSYSHSHPHHAPSAPQRLPQPPQIHVIPYPASTSSAYRRPSKYYQTETSSLNYSPATDSIISPFTNTPSSTFTPTDQAYPPHIGVEELMTKAVDGVGSFKVSWMDGEGWYESEGIMMEWDGWSFDERVMVDCRRGSAVSAANTRSQLPYQPESPFVSHTSEARRRSSCPQTTQKYSTPHVKSPTEPGPRKRAVEDGDFFGISKMLGIPPLLPPSPSSIGESSSCTKSEEKVGRLANQAT